MKSQRNERKKKVGFRRIISAAAACALALGISFVSAATPFGNRTETADSPYTAYAETDASIGRKTISSDSRFYSTENAAESVFGKKVSALTELGDANLKAGDEISGDYKVTKDTSFINTDDSGSAIAKSGLRIGGTTRIYIAKGVTLTVQGAAAKGTVGGGAGIYLPEGKTLEFYGEGTVKATGGKAENGASGGDVTGLTEVKNPETNKAFAEYDKIGYLSNGIAVDAPKGGQGGRGGGGGGAGIGGNGGDGAVETGYYNAYNPTIAVLMDYGRQESAKPGLSKSTTRSGSNGQAMGTLNVYNSVTIEAAGGAAGTTKSSGGILSGIAMLTMLLNSGSAVNTKIALISFGVSGAGGGGGGGGEGAPVGGGGGGGASGNYGEYKHTLTEQLSSAYDSFWQDLNDRVYKTPVYNGAGGGGGGGYTTNGAKGNNAQCGTIKHQAVTAEKSGSKCDAPTGVITNTSAGVNVTLNISYSGGSLGGGGTINNYTAKEISGTQRGCQKYVRSNVILDPITYAKNVLKASTTASVSAGGQTMLSGVTDGNTITSIAATDVHESDNNLETIKNAVKAAKSNNVSTQFYTSAPQYTSLDLNAQLTGYNIPEMDGYTFEGYYTGTGTDAVMAIQKDMTINPAFHMSLNDLSATADNGTSVYKLYAKWSPKKYTVTFDANGGKWSGGTNATQEFTFDANYTVPGSTVSGKSLSFSGWTFDGWSDNNYVDYDKTKGFSIKHLKNVAVTQDGTDKLAANANINTPQGEYKENVTVYAAWDRNISVNFEQYTNTSGKNLLSGGIKVYYNSQIPVIKNLASNTMPAFGGFGNIALEGIYTQAAGKGTKVWTDKGAVSVAASGGVNRWTFDTGSVYLGWKVTADLDKNADNGGVANKPSTDVTGFTSTKVTFMLGSNYTKNTSVSYPNPKRVGYNLAGYTFDRSYTDATKASLFMSASGEPVANGTTSQTDALSAKYSGYQTLYAVWTPKTYSVDLNGNTAIRFGSGSSSYLEGFSEGYTAGKTSVEVVFDQFFPTLAASELPKLVGFTFGGFYSEQEDPVRTNYITSAGKPNQRFDKNMLVNPNSESTGAKSLYAHWEIVEKKMSVALAWDKGNGTKAYLSEPTVELIRRYSYQNQTGGALKGESGWVRYSMSRNNGGMYTANVPRGEYLLVIDGQLYDTNDTSLKIYDSNTTVDLNQTKYIFHKYEFNITGDESIKYQITVLQSNGTTQRFENITGQSASYWVFATDRVRVKQTNLSSTSKTWEVYSGTGVGIEPAVNTNFLAALIGSDKNNPELVTAGQSLNADNYVVRIDCRTTITQIGFRLPTPEVDQVVGDYKFTPNSLTYDISQDDKYTPYWIKTAFGTQVNSTDKFESGTEYNVRFYIKPYGACVFGTDSELRVTITNGLVNTVYRLTDTNCNRIASSTSGLPYDLIEVTYSFKATAPVANEWVVSPSINSVYYTWTGTNVTWIAQAKYGNTTLKVLFAQEQYKDTDPFAKDSKWTEEVPQNAGVYYAYFYVEATIAYGGLPNGTSGDTGYHRFEIFKYNIQISEVTKDGVTYDGRKHSTSVTNTTYSIPAGVLNFDTSKAENVVNAGRYAINIHLNDSENYRINNSDETDITIHYVINKAKLTLSMNVFDELTYGYTLNNTVLTEKYVKATGLVQLEDGSTETLASALQRNGGKLPYFNFTTNYNTNAVKTRQVGTYNIEIVDDFTSTNYDYELISGTFKIVKKTIYITAKSLTKNYGDEYEFEYDIVQTDGGGFAFDDDTRLSVFGEIEVNKDVIQAVGFNKNNVKCGVYPLTLNGTLNMNVDNYEVILRGSDATFTLNRRNIKIKAADVYGVVYGTDSNTIKYTYGVLSLDDKLALVNGDRLEDLIVSNSTIKLVDSLSIGSNYNSTSSANRDAKTYTIIVSGPSQTDNYTIEYENGELVVEKADLKIKVKDTSFYYGTPNPSAYEYTASGYKYSDGEGVIDIGNRYFECGYDTGAAATRKVGTYTIKVFGLEAKNYNIILDESSYGTLTVEKLPLTLRAKFTDLVYGNTELNYTFTFEGNKVPYGDDAELIKNVRFSWAGNNGTVSSLDRLNVGEYLVDFTGNASVLRDNYEITLPTGVYVKVTPRKADLAFESDLKTVYGTENGKLPEFTFTADNMLEWDEALLRSLIASGKALLTEYNSEDSGNRGVGKYRIYIDWSKVDSDTLKNNYEFTWPDSTLTVEKRKITIGFIEDQEIVYGEKFEAENDKLEVKNGSFVYGESIASFDAWNLNINKDVKRYNGNVWLYDYDLSSFAHRQGGNYKIVLSLDEGVEADNYDISFADGALTVTPRKVKLVVNDVRIKYGDDFNVDNLSYEFTDGYDLNPNQALLLEDMAELKKLLTISCDGYDVGVYEKRKVKAEGYPFSVTAKQDSNYEIVSEGTSGKLIVEKRDITIKINAQEVVYGKEFKDFTVTYDGTLAKGDIEYLNSYLEFVCAYRTLQPDGTYIDKDVIPGGYAIRIKNNQILGERAENYSFEFDSSEGYLIVKKADLKVTLGKLGIIYGAVNPGQGDYSIANIEGAMYSGERESFMNGGLKLKYSTTYDLFTQAKRHVGEYAVSAEVIEQLQNYNVIILNSGENLLTVSKRDLTITASDINTDYGKEADYKFVTSGAAGEKIKNGLFIEDVGFVQYIIADCEYNTADKDLRNVRAGGYAIKVKLSNENIFDDYNLALVPGVLTVKPVELTITANDQTLTYGENWKAPGVTYEGFVKAYGDNENDLRSLRGTLKYKSTYDVADVNARGVGDWYRVTPEGLESDNYEITFVAGKITVNRKVIVLTADNREITYGAEVPADFRLKANLPGDFAYVTDSVSDFGTLKFTTNYNTKSSSSRGVGTYEIAIDETGLKSDNYEIRTVKGVLTVNKKTLDVEVDAKEITYGDEVKFTVSCTGWENGDKVANLGGELIFVTKYNPADPANRKVGEYSVRAEGYSSDNYEIVYHPAMLTVVKKDLTIKTNNYTIVWGEDAPDFKAVYGNFAFSEDETYLTGKIDISCDYRRFDDRGTYRITLSGYTSDNYNIIFESAVLNVNPFAVSAPAIASMYYTGATLIPKVPASEYYEVTTNDGGIAVGTYSVVLSLRNHPNVVWAGDETNPDSSPDKVVTYQILETSYIVSFVQEGGNYVKGDLTQEVTMGGFVVEANIPVFTRTGFTFGGWYTDKAFTNKFSVTTRIDADSVLYGYWVKNENALSGRVVNPDEEGMAEVTVTVIKNGKVLFTAITNSEGYFGADGIAAGLYNFAIAYSANDVDRAAVFAIDVTGDYDEMIKVVVDPQNVNTRVVVDSENIDFVADDLTNAFTKADLENVKAGGSVEFLVEIIENKFDRVNDFSNAAGLERKDVNGYFTIKASKQITDAQGKPTSAEVTETAGLVKFIVKLDENNENKSGYVLYRAMKDGGFETIGEKANDKGEYVKLSEDGKSLEVYVLETGDYAIGYDTANLSVTDWAHIVGGAGVLTVVMLVAWIAVARRRRNG